MMNRQTFFKSIIINLFFTLSLVYFPSMEVYLRNIAEFTFPARHVWWIMLTACLVVSGVISFFERLMPVRILNAFLAVTIALGLCAYVQSLFLNGYLQEMNGEDTQFDFALLIRNAAVWLAVACVVVILLRAILKKSGEKEFNEAIIFVSLGLIVIQSAGLFSSFTSVDPADSNKNLYLSSEGEFALSDNRNVVFFILDNCDGLYVREALEEDPNLFDAFDGFVYFPNAISKFSRTYPAVPYLFTREFCDFSKPYTEYITEAFENSDYLEEMSDTGVDIRIYTSLNYIAQNAYEYLNNISEYDSENLDALSPVSLIKAMIRLGGYNVMPYVLKPFFSYTVDPINRNVMAGLPEDFYTLTNNDFDFRERLLAKKITVNSSLSLAFRFYHLFGPHPGCYMNADAEYDADATQTEALRGDIKIIEEYLDCLKAAGIYDKTMIIITADHGNQNESDDLMLHAAPTCIMLVKAAGTYNDGIEISVAPVSHDNLFAAVFDAFGIDSGEFDESIFNVTEEDNSERLYYYTSQRSWTDGEVDLKEYKVLGDANDFQNWERTGKTWEIVYSANSVARK